MLSLIQVTGSPDSQGHGLAGQRCMPPQKCNTRCNWFRLLNGHGEDCARILSIRVTDLSVSDHTNICIKTCSTNWSVAFALSIAVAGGCLTSQGKGLVGQHLHGCQHATAMAPHQVDDQLLLDAMVGNHEFHDLGCTILSGKDLGRTELHGHCVLYWSLRGIRSWVTRALQPKRPRKRRERERER